MLLSSQDYKDILNHYQIEYGDSNKKTLKKMTEKIIAEKLCRCIKAVPNKGRPESRPIGICRWSVLQKKNLGIHKFTCKKKKELKPRHPTHGNKEKLYKIINGKLGLTAKTKLNKKTKKLTYLDN
tara:strand:+ start:3979 stop:4353 length:375 start_codon:yes stop_codon:yes gene_type:complete